jgi:hypothetical protein
MDMLELAFYIDEYRWLMRFFTTICAVVLSLLLLDSLMKDWRNVFLIVPFVTVLIGMLAADFKSIEKVQDFVDIKLAEVYQDISTEYGLNLENVESLKCIAGHWHYKSKDTTDYLPYSPVVSCHSDHEIIDRLKEAWSKDLPFPRSVGN